MARLPGWASHLRVFPPPWGRQLLPAFWETMVASQEQVGRDRAAQAGSPHLRSRCFALQVARGGEQCCSEGQQGLVPTNPFFTWQQQGESSGPPWGEAGGETAFTPRESGGASGGRVGQCAPRWEPRWSQLEQDSWSRFRTWKVTGTSGGRHGAGARRPLLPLLLEFAGGNGGSGSGGLGQAPSHSPHHLLST